MQFAVAHKAALVSLHASHGRASGPCKALGHGGRSAPTRTGCGRQAEAVLVDLEAPPIDEPARLRFAKLLDRWGAEHVALLIRTIIESEGNGNALVEPIISAVSSVMSLHRAWADRGLAWIEAFASIPLVGIVETMRGAEVICPKAEASCAPT
jgi:hypothetical protein